MSSPLQKIVEGKRYLRRELAEQPIGAKLRVLDALRAREGQIKVAAIAAKIGLPQRPGKKA